MDVSVVSFSVLESRIVADGANPSALTVTGTVDLSGQTAGSLTAVLYWSRDEVLDDADVNSGTTLGYNSTTITH